jgi:D-beta-D-heptose 7-phosphate kinase / D-beta-D-heptose 1-phosphate adenosyltransferase
MRIIENVEWESVSSAGATEGDGRGHLARLTEALPGIDVDQVEQWGRLLADRVRSGHRILVAGNGGSAAEAQHLTAELVGRFETERQPMSAIALHADTSTLTALGNDFGFHEVFARQVRAHGRPGDILLTLSASGRSANVCRAVAAARELGLLTWALTGPRPNHLASLADEAIAVPSDVVATVQECHLVVVHLLAMSFDQSVATRMPAWALARPPGQRPAARVTGAARLSGGQARLLVLGDAFLDRDVSGVVERLSPEAPVPVVSGMGVVSRPGGAGLAALMAARSGHDVTLVTALASDPEGEELRALLTEAGIKIINLELGGPTPVKSRIRASGRTLLMLDDSGAPTGFGSALDADATDALLSADGVLVSDYGRGMATVPGLRAALERMPSGVPVVWDPHPRGPEPLPGVVLATPNAREAAQSAGRAHEPHGLENDLTSAQVLLGRWSAAQIAVTRGALGAVLVQDKSAPPLVVSATASEGDSCGAGDRFAVAATTMLAAGLLPSEAVTEAVSVASAYVASGGPTSLAARPAGRERPRTGRPTPFAVVRQVRARGGTVVATGGCFDLLHTGHVHLLDKARRLGDCLIVCLNSDDSVARLKGPTRPIVAQADREAMMLALRSVDAVLVFDEDTPERALRLLQPDIFVKGGDYSLTDLPEAAVVRSWGGHAVTVPYLAGRSTTTLIHQVVRES